MSKFLHQRLERNLKRDILSKWPGVTASDLGRNSILCYDIHAIAPGTEHQIYTPVESTLAEYNSNCANLA